MLEDKKHDVKETWKILNSVIKRKSYNTGVTDQFVSKDNKILTDKKDIANGFNEFFVNVGPELAKKIEPPDSNISVNSYIKTRNMNSMFLSAVVEQEIVNIVKNNKNKTSKDCHDINMCLVKKLILQIVQPLTYICNRSFQDGLFPEKMKIAKVLPLFKSGDKDKFTNYRPVSLLPQFSKILEKLFVKRLDNFIDKFNLLDKSQYGFRANSSTSLALLELTEEITNALDDKKTTIGVYIDLKKAFDTIDHGILLKKLEQYGIRGASNSWVMSYLSNRLQFVNYNDYDSNLLQVVCGVPQGSILGPKLFILYINDICNVSKILKLILFADDTTLFCSDKNINNLVTIINSELEKLCVWFALNKLSLNVSKTNYMLFSNCKNNIPNVGIFMKNCKIDRVHVTKFLGVQIDENLDWNHHIWYVKSKISKHIGILNRARKYFGGNAIRTLYCSLILPYLLYCVEVWGNTYSSNLNAIILLQKKAIRIIANVPRLEHTNDIFMNFKLLKFMDLVKLSTLLVMFRAYNINLPSNLQKCFSININTNLATRRKNKFTVNYVRTTKKAMCLSVKGVKLWNSLDLKFTLCNNINLFKNNLKQCYLDEYKYN
jgi:hypothetical protein